MKKAAIINDLSGIGRCSLAVSISILSVLKVQPCALPTAILSSQTGYSEYTFLDFTPYMKDYYTVWENLKQNFDTIYTGFLASVNQINYVLDFILRFKNNDTLVIIDPVMGDDGELYSIYPKEYPKHMKNLIKYADVITPNATEFSLLTGYDFLSEGINKELIKTYVKDLGPKQIVITGIKDTNYPELIVNLCVDCQSGEHYEHIMPHNNISYSGTGDIFASIVCGYLTQGKTLIRAVEVASDFIKKAVEYTYLYSRSSKPKDGILYEQFLKELDV